MDYESEFLNELLRSPSRSDVELLFNDDDDKNSIATSTISPNVWFVESSRMNLHSDGPPLEQRHQSFDGGGCSKPWNSGGVLGSPEEQYGPGQFDFELRYIESDYNNSIAPSSINPSVGFDVSLGMNLPRDGPHLQQRNQSFDGSGNSKHWNFGEGFTESSWMNLHRDGPQLQQRNQSFDGSGSSKPWSSDGGFGFQEEQYGPSHTRSDMFIGNHCSKTDSREDCNPRRPRARALQGQTIGPHSIAESWEMRLHRDEPQSQQRNQNFDRSGNSKQWNSAGGFGFQEELYGPGQSGVALRYIDDENNNLDITNSINPNTGFIDNSGMNLYRDGHQSQQRSQTFDGSGSSKLWNSGGGFDFQEEQYAPSQAKSDMLMENHGSKNLQNYSLAASREATTMADRHRFQPPQTDSSENCNPARPRARARRGQATDPHSIAERLRRERIADGIRHLQELLPNPIRSDKASFLGEMIDYVKSLQNQMMDLSINCGAGDNLEKDGQSQDDTRTPDDAAFERELVGLMESNNMDKAMQLLQSKGLHLVPVSQASAIALPEGNKSVVHSMPPNGDTCVIEVEPEDARASQKRRGA